MAVTIFAAIDVGSHETSLRIYEISKKYGIHEIEAVHHTARLGLETYSTRHLSYHTIDKLCNILNGFSAKMKEYAITDYMIVATSALREADNSLIVLDRVRQRTGFYINILSNSEQRYLCYKSIALQQNAFHKLIQKGTLLVDVGGGSIQLSLFDMIALVTTQNIMIGSLRINEILQDMKSKTDNYKNLVYEYIANDLHNFVSLYISDHKVKNIIAIGNQLKSFVKYLSVHHFGNLQPLDSKGNKKDSISRAEYEEFYQAITSQSSEELAQELNIALDKADLLLPIAMIYHNIFEETKAEQIWLSGITICDGMAADFAEKREKIVPAHNFSDGIVSASRNIAKRYKCDVEHVSNVENICLKIFDALKKQYGFSKRERLMLQIAAILHSCGNFINLNNAGENSYKIVMSSEIIGLSHKERKMIAYIVRYPSEAFPNYLDIADVFEKEDFIKAAKLNAILKLAISMDKSHRQKFKDISVELKGGRLTITGNTLYDTTLEQGIFKMHSDFFEELYGIQPALKQRKQF